jgi:hypothetical protein
MADLTHNIQNAVINLLPANRKKSSDWISFNAVCCRHNGESQDRRGRGGVRTNPDGAVTYHCFNCGFKAGFYPGRTLGFRFRKLMRWMGADENTIQWMVMEALRVRELMPHLAPAEPEPALEIKFSPRPLPDDSVSLSQVQASAPANWVQALTYLDDRKINLSNYEFYLTDTAAYNLNRRIIIPFYWKGELIGYTARSLDDSTKTKYHSSYEPNYVFNTDKQPVDGKFAIVCEGPFDAMSVDGVAVLSNDISDTQADILESLGRELVVVPDWDKAGEKLIERAIEFGWTVSFPVWRETCKDVNEAVIQYGKLFVIKSILDARETNPVKIKLRMKL